MEEFGLKLEEKEIQYTRSVNEPKDRFHISDCRLHGHAAFVFQANHYNAARRTAAVLSIGGWNPNEISFFFLFNLLRSQGHPDHKFTDVQ